VSSGFQPEGQEEGGGSRDERLGRVRAKMQSVDALNSGKRAGAEARNSVKRPGELRRRRVDCEALRL
jgi:hypothetical protein